MGLFRGCGVFLCASKSVPTKKSLSLKSILPSLDKDLVLSQNDFDHLNEKKGKNSFSSFFKYFPFVHNAHSLALSPRQCDFITTPIIDKSREKIKREKKFN